MGVRLKKNTRKLMLGLGISLLIATAIAVVYFVKRRKSKDNMTTKLVQVTQSCTADSDCAGTPTYLCAYPDESCEGTGHCYPDCNSTIGHGYECAAKNVQCAVVQPGPPSPAIQAPSCGSDYECSQYGSKYHCACPASGVGQTCADGGCKCYADCSTTSPGEACSTVNGTGGDCAFFYPTGHHSG